MQKQEIASELPMMLRQKTGLSVSECVKLLERNSWDVQKAYRYYLDFEA